MSSSPYCKERQLVERIRLEHSPSGYGKLAILLNGLLDFLASDLYDTPTRFLQELLQNADDNSYPENVTPTLKLTYRPGALRVDCNEIGFTAKDVEAICSTRQSTKSGRNHAKGFTGEKGIGFKSVFKVADIVWISSGNYKFKFDKNKEYGTIAPDWAEFPNQEKTLPSHTSFYLQLSNEMHEGDLVEALRIFEPSQVLFLRRIRKIILQVKTRAGEEWTETISRNKSSGSEDKITVSGNRKLTLEYFTTKYEVKDLPQEARRPGCTKSELSLAFPVNHFPNEPPYSPHCVYAFLPIGSYGLKFLLQGDFVLTGSRLHIDTSLPWNIALRNAFADAFVASVHQLNRSKHKNFWPWFIPGPETSPFFQPARDSILRILGKEKVLSSCSKYMAEPGELVYVPPEKFLADDGQPFALSDLKKSQYLSSNYPDWIIDSICSLGVRTLSEQDFLQDLQAIMSSNPDSFYRRTSQWHSQFAKALISINKTSEFETVLSKLKIIPLENHKWAAAAEQLFFAPGGITDYGDLGISNLKLVSQEAVADKNRLALYQLLGIKQLDAFRMCHLIITAHASRSRADRIWTQQQLISQVKFLFTSSYQPSQKMDMWFMSSENTLTGGSQLYIPGGSTEDSATSRVLEKLFKRYPTLHDDYLSDGPVTKASSNIVDRSKGFDKKTHEAGQGAHELSSDNADWRNYLIKALHLSEIPKLVIWPREISGLFLPSGHFKYLFAECQTRDVLSVLSDNWHSYSQWIETDSPLKNDSHWSKSRTQLISDLKNTFVSTKDGTPARLRDTVIPGLDRVLDDDSLLPLLDIYKPEDKVLRQRLTNFGVITDNDINYYIYCLKTLRGQQDPSTETVSYVYEQLQDRYDNNEDKIENAFWDYKLIYVKGTTTKDSKKGVWLDPDECMRKKLKVETQYPTCEYLFRSLLAPEGFQTGTLIAKAALINRSSKLEDILYLFTEISSDLKLITSTKTAAHKVKSLLEKAIFPIKRGKSKNPFDDLLPSTNQDWFIADRPHLRASFAGKVPLLAFDVAAVESMIDLIGAMNLGDRKLSTITKKRTDPLGPLMFREFETSIFRSCAPAIKALIPSSNNNRGAISTQLINARISTAGGINHTYTLTHDGIDRNGCPDKGQVALFPKESYLQMYFAQDTFDFRYPSYEFIDLLARYCAIENPMHQRLLYAAFSEPNLGSVQSIFAKQGIFVDLPNDSEQSESKRRYARSGNVFTIPTPYQKNYRDGYDSSDYSDDMHTDLVGFRHRQKIRRHRNKNGRPGMDRRIPIMHFNRVDLDADGQPTFLVLRDDRLDYRKHLAFIGQWTASKLFERHLGKHFDPLKHWTSSLRTRAGLPAPEKSSGKAAFTIAGAHALAVTKLLITQGYSQAEIWKDMKPTYHFEVAASAGDADSTFIWSTGELKRIRKYQLPTKIDGEVTDVAILVRISNAYNNPQIDLLVNPWACVVSGALELQGDWYIEASIKRNSIEQSTKTFNNPNKPSTATGSRPSKISGSIKYPQIGTAKGSPHMSPASPPHPQSPNYYAGYNNPYLPMYYSFPTVNASYYGSSWTATSGPYQMPSVAGQIPNYPHYPQWPMQHVAGDQRFQPSTEKKKSSNFETDIEQYINSAGFVALKGSEMTDVPYVYKDLGVEQMRLFLLFPGEEKDSLRGMISTFPLPTKSKDAGTLGYRTLSYVWGGADQPTHTLITPNGTLNLHESICNALIRLRQKGSVVILWVDTICINQANEKEKEQQILYLPRIFQGAACTVGFLGADDKSDTAIETLLQIRANDLHGSNTESWPKELSPIPPSWNGNPVPPAEDPIWIKIEELFNRPWFRRIWIVQEAVAAPTVVMVCGKWTVDWNDLLHSMEIIEHEQHLPESDISTSWTPFLRLSHLREWEARNSRCSLFLLLETFRYAESSLKRDRFFALLGLAHDGHATGFEPDYGSPLEVIVRKIGCTLVAQGEGMKLLYRAGLGPQAHRFPSWIPDWTTPKAPSLSESQSRGVEYDASGGLKTHLSVFNSEIGILGVAGWLADEIEYIGMFANEPAARKSYFEEVESMVDSLGASVTEDEKNRIKREVPIAGAVHPRVAISENLDIEESYDAYRKIMKKANFKSQKAKMGLKELSTDIQITVPMEPNEKMTLLDKSKNYVSLLGDTLQGWRFVITKKKRCGIVPGNAQVGDLVAILGGAKVPFILRRSSQPESATYFRLVGESYIDSAMQGEALSDPDLVCDWLCIY